jgi:hypothetical protein
MSAIVFLEIPQPGDAADKLVSAIKDAVPVAYAEAVDANRIEVYFSSPAVDDDDARESLEKAITAHGDESREFVRVVYPPATAS